MSNNLIRMGLLQYIERENWRSIKGGRFFALGVTVKGVAYAWGSNTVGQLGDNTIIQKETPVLVCGGLKFSSIFGSKGGGEQSMALTSQGVAYAWGSNTNGALGNNSLDSSRTPVLVCGGHTFTTISVGNNFSLALTNQGVAYAWGNNASGRLGINSLTASSLTPVLVCGGYTFTSVATTNSSSYGLTSTGVAYSWGDNTNGRLGINSLTASSLTPVLVCGGYTFTAIAGGGDGTVLALTNQGVAYGWGNNANGQIGDGTNTSRVTPVLVCGGYTFTAISVGNGFSVALTNQGVAYAWGGNTNGQLGDGTNTARATPVLVCGGHTFTSISTSNGASFALTSKGVAYAWGTNANGQLGINSLVTSSTPVQVSLQF